MSSGEPGTGDAALIDECARRAAALLRANLGPSGFVAARPDEAARRRGYDRVFARDAAICVLAAAELGDAELLAGAERSLAALAAGQAGNGQLPKYVDPSSGKGDFWYLGCIDASLWWLIALHHLDAALPGTAAHFATPAARAVAWLSCQEHPQLFLLQQNEASDWADIMPRSGFVLYSNALWYDVKRLYGLPAAATTREHFNCLFHPFGGHRPDYKRLGLLRHYVRRRARNSELYLSFVNLGSWGEEGDVFGNLLAVLFGLADDHRSNRILAAVAANQDGAAYPVRAVCDPIGRGDALWRDYMGRHRQNLAHRYHNGGIWPFVGGFWGLALAGAGRRDEAIAVLSGLAHACAADGWAFREWFDGRSGMPEGMVGQSWNAAAFLLAARRLDGPVFRSRGV